MVGGPSLVEENLAVQLPKAPDLKEKVLRSRKFSERWQDALSDRASRRRILRWVIEWNALDFQWKFYVYDWIWAYQINGDG